MCLFIYTPPYLFEPSVRDQLRSGSLGATAYSLNLLRNSASGFQLRMAQSLLGLLQNTNQAIALRRRRKSTVEHVIAVGFPCQLNFLSL
jgi:hypothetical protein